MWIQIQKEIESDSGGSKRDKNKCKWIEVD